MTKRTERVNKLIQRRLGEILIRKIDFPAGCLVTINRVDVASDLKHAKVFVSVLPVNRRGTALELLKRKGGELQSLLNKKLVTHHVPKIQFFIDDSEERAEEIEKLLNEVKTP